VSLVFISGSRGIRRLDVGVQLRLERIIDKKLPVLIGDANGADKAVQGYLISRGYDLVEVFCAGETPRNNVGGWKLRRIQPSHAKRDFDYYASKDREMAREATLGLLIWDGESGGTLMNVLRLVSQQKTAVVYINPQKAFSEIRSRGDFDKLTRDLGEAAKGRLLEQAIREGLMQPRDEERALPSAVTAERR